MRNSGNFSVTVLPTIPEKFAHLPLPPPSRGYDLVRFLPFILVHVACLGVFWTGARPIDWAVFGLFYFFRIFGVMAGYHRYFSHRTFKTSRAFQLVLAVLAMTTGQKGVLWWAAHHRNHHKFSDLPWDVHSPVQHSFMHSHVGWICERGSSVTDYDKVKDFAKYPELRWLNENWMWVPIALGTLTYLALGWSGLVVGFFFSTVAVWHATFLVNSLSHVIGKRRFATDDYSRNHWLIAIVTIGEGWHNNHHHYQASVRQGFYWWEIDLCYYVLRLLAWCGIVWDLRLPPAAVLAEGRARDAAARSGAAMPVPVPVVEVP